MVKRTERKAFEAWVERNGLLPRAKGGFGVIGSARLISLRSEGTWAVEVCRPSDHGYPGGFGYDYPVGIAGVGTLPLLAFFEKPYKLEASVTPKPNYTPAPCTVGHDCSGVMAARVAAAATKIKLAKERT